MTWKDWFSRPSPLQRALSAGMRPGADLADELRTLRDYPVRSKADAEAICHALARLADEVPPPGGDSALHDVVALFQDCDGAGCPAFPVLREQGLPLLVRLVDDALHDPARHDPDDVLFVLKVLAVYATPQGTDAVLRAARKPLRPDAYLWSVILGAYPTDHPERARLFRELGDPLPGGFLAVSLLDAANAGAREGAGDPHPFDSPAGIEQLERWLTDKDEDHFSYAVSAAAALPFVNGPGRDALLAVALEHASPDVRTEAAWAAATLGREAGVQWLARSCLELDRSRRAKRYLLELGRADAIPAESEEANFNAKAEFAEWLAHPNELGRPADELEVVDHRELDWPPERKRTPLWLIRYRLRDQTGLKEDDVGIGLVGSVTFCLFSYGLHQRPPEDAYAIHCYWEMTGRGLIAEEDVAEGSREYDGLLRQSALDGVTDARVAWVAEPSPELKYPQQLVALARAKRHGESGWLVLDGPRSRWYAASEMPGDVVTDKTVLMVHVGRTLLGFIEQPDRRRYLKPAASGRPPEDVVRAYERLLDEARSDEARARKLLGSHSVLGSSFSDYVDALAAVRGLSKAACTCAAYEALLSAAERSGPAGREEVFDSFSPLGENFTLYVDALIGLDRRSEVPALVERFRPHWDHNLGYGKLGSAAFKSGHDALAESFLVRLRQLLKDWHRCEEMNDLAEVWLRQGRVEEARALLTDALRGLVEGSRSASGSDRQVFEDWFQDRRAAYLRLFPERGAAELERRGIPRSTVTPA